MRFKKINLVCRILKCICTCELKTLERLQINKHIGIFFKY